MPADEPAFDPQRILETLERHGVEYVLVGGFGSQVRSAIRQTIDLDLVPSTTTENDERLAAALPCRVRSGLGHTEPRMPSMDEGRPDVSSCMPGDRWSEWFWTATDSTSGSEVCKAYGFDAVELTDERSVVRWSPVREVFTHLPDAGNFVWGGAVGAVLHAGTMFGAVVVLSDNEFPMTLQEDHRFMRAVMFDQTYLVTGKPTRRTRHTLWTTTTIVVESSGQMVADATSVNQLVEQND